jgi:signal transduction histidine kinase
MRRWVPLSIAAAGLAFGVFAEWQAARGVIWSPAMVVVDSAGGAITLLAGIVVWLSRPDSRVGPVITLMGLTWFPGALGYSNNQDYVDFVGFPLSGWDDVVLVALVLLFPLGRIGSRPAAVVLAGTAASHLVVSLARLLLRVPVDLSSCFCVSNRILPVTDPAIYNRVDRIASVAEASFAIAALLIVVVRWRRATGPARRTFGWIALAGVAAAGLVFYNRLHTRLFSDFLQSTPTMQIVMDLVRVTVPLAAAIVLVRGRRARARVADLVVGFSEQGLRRALADPTVRLLRWSPVDETHRDEEGRPVELPADATVLEADGVRLGALLHDPALREEPELLTAVVAAARMALHNERLAAEVRAQLEEVQGSRRRLLEVADAERRRLERDLHDGAQQYLLAVRLEAQRAQRRADALGDDELTRRLGDVATHAETALEQLRALARGIRPPVLTESGLGPALESLAERLALPVALEVAVDGRLDDVVEATAYLVASEALTNVLKYADARHVELRAACLGDVLELRVRDDGRGGAVVGAGTGLAGLADRVAALGGTLDVSSPLGEGTTIRVSIPLSPVPIAPADQFVEAARR